MILTILRDVILMASAARRQEGIPLTENSLLCSVSVIMPATQSHLEACIGRLDEVSKLRHLYKQCLCRDVQVYC